MLTQPSFLVKLRRVFLLPHRGRSNFIRQRIWLTPDYRLLTPGFSMDRVSMLKEILGQNPSDAFARYGLAMEYSNAGQVEDALREFGALLEANPDYTAGYFMAAQMLAREGREEEARKLLRDGIAAAQRTRNQHAQSEMEGMLGELGG